MGTEGIDGMREDKMTNKMEGQKRGREGEEKIGM